VTAREPEGPDRGPPPWTFGAEPLPQAGATARLLRDLAGLVVALEADGGVLGDVIQDLRRAEARLRERVPADLTPRVGAAVGSDGRVYLDHSRDIGAFDACFPEYEIEVEDDVALGTVTFPLAFEGPPGIVHGGFLAVFFDCVVQHHNCDLGVAGKTTSLALRYRRPAPLGRELRFGLTRDAHDRRITSEGRLLLDGDVLCEATIEAVAGDRSALPETSPRRSAP
jgi:hypothetical protein